MQRQDDYLAGYRSLKLKRELSNFTPRADRSDSRHKIIRNLSMPFTGSPKIERTRL